MLPAAQYELNSEPITLLTPYAISSYGNKKWKKIKYIVKSQNKTHENFGKAVHFFIMTMCTCAQQHQ